MSNPQRCRDQMQAPMQPALLSLIVQSLKYARAPARAGIQRDRNAERNVRQPGTTVRGVAPGDAAASERTVATCSRERRCGRGEPA
jgi:hypothetical protein